MGQARAEVARTYHRSQAMEGLTFTPKEQTRLQVLIGVLEHRVGVDEAAQVLGLSERHLWRILAACRKEGPDLSGLAHGNRGRQPGNAVSARLRDRVLDLAQERYAGANRTHLT